MIISGLWLNKENNRKCNIIKDFIPNVTNDKFMVLYELLYWEGTLKRQFVMEREEFVNSFVKLL